MPRGKCCAELNICSPLEDLWKPQLRQAATPVAATEWSERTDIDDSELDTELLSPDLCLDWTFVETWKIIASFWIFVSSKMVENLTDSTESVKKQQAYLSRLRKQSRDWETEKREWTLIFFLIFMSELNNPKKNYSPKKL
jgi:hypothetical protein